MNVGSDEIFIRLSEIHDPFDNSDNVHDAGQSKATQDGDTWLKRRSIVRLHWPLRSNDRQGGLAVQAGLCKVGILSAALSTEDCHFLLSFSRPSEPAALVLNVGSHEIFV